MTDNLILKTTLQHTTTLEAFFLKGELSNPNKLITLIGEDICFVIDQGFLRSRKDLELDDAGEGWQGTSNYPIYIHSGGERYRTWNELRLLLVWLNKNHIKRSTTIVSIGGEATHNVVGAAAAMWKGGTNWIAVPTTLQLIVNNHLFMPNSFNFCDIYNLLGVSHTPSKILVDPDLFCTLSYRRIVEGLLDATKLALSTDLERFNWILENAEKLVLESEPNQQTKLFHLTDLHYDLIKWAIKQNTATASESVEALNLKPQHLDNLYGRALEELSMLKVQSSGGFTNPKAAKMVVGHARALAAGIILAHNYASSKEMLEAPYIEQIVQLFDLWNLPTQIYPGWRTEADKLWQLMNNSAEGNGYQIRASVPCALGKTIETSIVKDDFMSSLNI